MRSVDNPGRQLKTDSALSETIGSLILMAVFSLLVVVILVMLVSQSPADEVPAVLIGADWNGSVLILTHKGGDDLSREYLVIRVDGVDRTSEFTDRTGSFSWEVWTAGEDRILSYGSEPERIQVISTGISGGGSGNEYLLFDLGSGTFGTPAPPHTITLRPTSTTTSTPTVTVTETPRPPVVAEFSASPTSGLAPLAVQFTDASTQSPMAWSWNFGDGGTSSVQNPIHTYSSAGTYTVTLTASNAWSSDAETKTDYIQVLQPYTRGIRGLYYQINTGQSRDRGEDTVIVTTGKKPVEQIHGEFRFADSFARLVYFWVPITSVDSNWPDGSGTVSSGWLKDDFYVEWDGYLYVDTDDTYNFWVNSDEGIEVLIDGSTLYRYWAPHSLASGGPTSSHLTVGYHPIEVKYYDFSGAAIAQIEWASATNPSRFARHFITEMYYLE